MGEKKSGKDRRPISLAVLMGHEGPPDVTLSPMEEPIARAEPAAACWVKLVRALWVLFFRTAASKSNLHVSKARNGSTGNA